MPRSGIKCYVRTRPLSSATDAVKVAPDGCTITLKLPKDAEAGLINNATDTYTYKFDAILENASQEQVYTAAASEVVDSVLSGYSGCVFAYGQTGSGKTFSMAGDIRNYQHRGVIPRALHHIFREVDMRVDKLYDVAVSYLEVYNETLYDLLAEKPGSTDGLSIGEDTVQGTYVRGLTKVPVRSEEEALAQYFVGEQGRSTAHHVLNSSSSRSHCIFTVHLNIRTSEAASERAVLARLHLVDLAGSERTKKTNVTGQSLIEAQFINKSLSFLEQTVNALSRKESHVPYRQSRLTSVLKDALGGNCKTCMIANIWGEQQHIEETLSTLRFASRVRTLTTETSLTESSDPTLLLRRYERQIRELKQELAMRDALSGRGRVSYEDLGDNELKELQGLVKQFVQGNVDVEQLPGDSLKRIREAYKALRGVAAAAQEEVQAQLNGMQANMTAAIVNGSLPGSVPASAPGAVGEIDFDRKGFQVGVAPADLRPPGSMQLPPGLSNQHAQQGSTSPAPTSGAAHSARPDTDHQSLPGLLGEKPSEAAGTPGGAHRAAAFTRYKHEVPEGCNLCGVVKERQQQLRGVKIALKESGAAVNQAKAAIDQLNARLAHLAPQTEPDVVDVERATLLQELKAAKMSYRREFDALKDMQSAVEPLTQSVTEAKQELLDGFDSWYTTVGQSLAESATDLEDVDAGEAFERMQTGNISAVDPDSVAYHTALRKTAGLHVSSNKFGGVKAAADQQRKKERQMNINTGRH